MVWVWVCGIHSGCEWLCSFTSGRLETQALQGTLVDSRQQSPEETGHLSIPCAKFTCKERQAAIVPGSLC